MQVPLPTDEPDPGKFLAAGRIIDCDHPSVYKKAMELAAGQPDDAAMAERCSLFVRDEIRHSADFQENPVTLRIRGPPAPHRVLLCQEPPARCPPLGKWYPGRPQLPAAHR